MKTPVLLFLFCLILIAPFAAKAQDRGEINVFGGISGLAKAFDTRSGWNASIAGNIAKHLALVADFSGHYSGGSTGWFGSEASHSYSFLFGPRYVHTIGKRWTPFAHALFGPYRETLDSGRYPGSNSRNMMAMAFGGGLDVRITNRFSIRAIQLDVVRAENNNYSDAYGRLSVGAIFHLTRASEK